MTFENKYLSHIAPYKLASHGIWEVAPELRKNVLKLDWNEATIPPAPRAIDRVNRLMEQVDIFSLYPSTYNSELIKLLAKYCGVNENQVQYFPSSDVIHELFIRTFAHEGDTVLLINPTYDNFRLTCESQGCKVSYFELDEGFVWNPSKYQEALFAISPKLAYICNPNNPTGYLIPLADIEMLVKNNPQVLFLLDEAYYEFANISGVNLVSQVDNLVVSRTFSKAFALANFRIGYAISNQINMDHLGLLRNAKNISTFSQEAAIGVLEQFDYTQQFVDEVLLARTEFTNALNQFKCIKHIYPSHANFILVEFDELESKMQWINHLTEHQIYVRNLTHSKKLERCIRFTIGTSAQMNHVSAVLLKLQG